MRHVKEDKPAGILTPGNKIKNYYLQRYLPSKDLEFFIEHYWFVKWDLAGEESFVAETLPHPSIHLVFEKKTNQTVAMTSSVLGVVEGKFSRKLTGKGEVFGIKFKPGAFYPFYKKDIFELTNNKIQPSEVFGDEFISIENLILKTNDEEEMINIAEDFLIKNLPEKDDKILLINEIVQYIIAEKNIFTVDRIVKKFKTGLRPLQRLFKQYVGISPKWMIQRYRLHDAAQLLSEKKDVDLVTIALNLGYFDQAHFHNDFKKVIGKTPTEFAKEINS